MLNSKNIHENPEQVRRQSMPAVSNGRDYITRQRI